MPDPLRLGIAGLGTVGRGVIRIIQARAELLRLRTGRDIVITAVCARDQSLDRGVDLSGYAWETDAVALAQRPDIDIFVELMGGSEGPALDATRAALAAGKDVINANKAMMALHGQELAETAEAAGLCLRFEAGIAGTIPAVKALTESLAGNQIERVMGVMNGTCNYILTRMQSAGLTYDAVFAEARDLGYLEADPTLDVGGIDAGHKLALLASIAFGTKVNFDGVHLDGIEKITIEDIRRSEDLGYKIKLLGVAQMTGRGLEQRMTPCLVPATSPIGQLENATNMVMIEGDASGRIVLQGAGAGEGPTASAVLSDVLDLARGLRLPTFGQPAVTLTKQPSARSATPAAYYLRLELLDKPGALAKIATILGNNGISINRMRQYGHAESKAPVLIVTHKTTRVDLDAALSQFPATGVIAEDPVAIRIEQI